ncbi:choice-of-anchor K domain-containing protein [Opitutus terrae]|uniref:Ice-binding protein C-terminal domain-containing protein n=1 Tax=Opitutus terrae (strain DSM 11246 / JCM 15787 / PB90-1) TaxID=452637 RepID=B1ZMF9_OPITP|nr:choice-of-anchor K domain-containing protein [Opitutus terrae]ACB73412.1 hypothetical protein Oter_0121 [Opitutus terrae PB90-1]
MHSRFKYTLAAACLAVALIPLAQAQLLLSGNVTGEFTDAPGPNDTIYNAPDGSSNYFRSGIPETAADLQTAIEFWKVNFTDVGPGLVASDLFKVTNGRTLLHSTATAAHFDLNLELTAPESQDHMLTSIAFTIENTPNQPNDINVNDWYTITATGISPFQVGDYLVQFEFVAPESFQILENSSLRVGDLYVRFTPVPEPSTYAAFGAALLLGVVGFRRFRNRAITI